MSTERTVFTRCRIFDDAHDGGLFDIAVDVAGVITRVSAADASGAPPAPPDTTVVDVGGRAVVPGFLDIQCNGAIGVDFADPGLTADGVVAVAAELARHGVTAFCPTLISSSPAVYASALPLVQAVMEAQRDGAAAGRAPTGARVIGVHLEGPFLHRERKGAHAEWSLRAPADVAATAESADGPPTATVPPLRRSTCGLPPSVAAAFTVDGTPDVPAGLVRVVTLAPELPGAMAAIADLRAAGVVVAIGHTTADLPLAAAAAGAGAALITHLFNAMAPFAHRNPGVVGLLGGAAAVVNDGVSVGGGAADAQVAARAPCAAGEAASAAATTASASVSADVGTLGTLPFDATPVPLAWPASPPCFSLIADGAHVHPAALALAFRAHPGGAVLVTDAMRALGLPPGEYRYGPLRVVLHAGADAGDGAYPGRHVVLAGSATLAGAVLPLDACVRNLQRWSACGLQAAVRAATATPARLLRVDGAVGALAAGRRADLVVLEGGAKEGAWRVRSTWVDGHCVWDAAR